LKLLVKELNEMFDQERDIIGALSERRHVKNTSLQSVVEVLAQAAGSDSVLGCAVSKLCERNHSDCGACNATKSSAGSDGPKTSSVVGGIIKYQPTSASAAAWRVKVVVSLSRA
jgi:hypothetical protein